MGNKYNKKGFRDMFVSNLFAIYSTLLENKTL